jgi:hypothetical protein
LCKKLYKIIDISNKDILFELCLQSNAFKATYEMITAIEIFGCSSAVCESTFSCLTRLENLHRLSIKHKRLSNLVLLAFEFKWTENLNLDILLMDFNKQKIENYNCFNLKKGLHPNLVLDLKLLH